MADRLERLQQDFDELERRLNEAAGLASTAGSGPLGPTIPDFQPLPEDRRTPAANQLWNGDFSHSVNTWNDAVAVATDKSKECFNWFSNDPMTVGQALDFTDARISSVNKTLKEASHSTYDPLYVDWMRSKGYARLTGVKTLDAPLPQNTAYPGRIMYLGAIVARADARIVVAEDTHLSAGIYDNTAGQRDWLKANTAFAITTAEVRGTPAATEELKYKIFAKTDRGYTYLSSEITVAGGPTPASFNPNCDVYVGWERIEGVLEYWVIRHRTGPNIYDILAKIGSGANNFVDNNTIVVPNTGTYPAASEDRARAFVATAAKQRDDGTWINDLATIAIDGVAASWDHLFLNIAIPSGYDQGLTTDRQVLRIALDRALDRRMTDAASTAGTPSVSSATGIFSTLDTGRIATLYAADGVTVLHGPEAITFVDATHVTFATNVATTEADVILYIVGGGDFGLLIDCVHLGYTEAASYSPHPDDFSEARRLQPAATPNGSTQGGSVGGGGTGGGGDGGIGGCILVTLPVAAFSGDGHLSLPFQAVKHGQALPSGNIAANYVRKIMISECRNVWRVRVARSRVVWWERIFGRCYIELVGSPGQRMITSGVDRDGVEFSALQVGAFGVVSWHGRTERSQVIESSAVGEPAMVGIFAMSPGHTFFAGRLVRPRVIEWLRRFLQIKDQGPNGALLHNVKNGGDQLVF